MSARKSRLEIVRRWRDQTREHYGNGAPDGTPAIDLGTYAWWADVDAVLNELDRANATIAKLREDHWS